MMIRTMNRKTYFCLAMFSLVIATTVPWLLRRFTAVNGDITDGVHGLLMGIAIGINLIVVAMGVRWRQRM